MGPGTGGTPPAYPACARSPFDKLRVSGSWVPEPMLRRACPELSRRACPELSRRAHHERIGVRRPSVARRGIVIPQLAGMGGDGDHYTSREVSVERRKQGTWV